MNEFGQQVAVKNEAGEVIGFRQPEVRRVTRNGLSGCHGLDKGKRIVASLRVGDLIVLRPERSPSSRELSITAQDLWTHLVRKRANAMALENARAKKQKKSEQRERARIARADRKLRLEAKALKAKGGQ